MIFNFFVILLFKFSFCQELQEDERYMIREHSLVKPYQGSGASVPYWDFLGSTMITNNFIRLTGEFRSQKGAIWNKIPNSLPFWDMQIHFKVHGKDKKLFGDGFAFWYVKEPMQHGDVFGYKDYFSGLAVFADTYNNHNGPHKHDHPYLSAMINNGTLHYDHDRDGTHTQLDGCVSKFRNMEHDTYISVRYSENSLSVFTDIKNKGVFDLCFKVDGVFLPTGYFFGVSAATGDLVDAHDIISMKLYDLTIDSDLTVDRGSELPRASHFEAPRERTEDIPQRTGWEKLMLVTVGVLLICAVVIVGGLMYNKHQEEKRKRFY